MKRRKLGNLEVSAIGLGAGLYGKFRQDDVTALIRRAVERGIDMIDTADVYANGTHEEFVGRAIKGMRDKIVLATKFGNIRDQDNRPAVDGRPAYVPAACEKSLKRLGVDCIDLYYIHRVDPAVPIEETIGAMARLKDQGKIRHLGISEAAPATLRRAHAAHPITALQSEYSLWTRDPEKEVLAVCAELGIGFAAYSPLGRGFLTGTIAEDASIATTDLRSRHPRFQAENIRRNTALVEALKRLGAAENCSPAQLALAWLLGRGDSIVPLPGTRQLRWLEENIAAVDLAPSAATLRELDTIFAPAAVAGERFPADMLARVNI
jgi:aryl-alcohol dehydrogenase-like predicted oxidoreductase